MQTTLMVKISNLRSYLKSLTNCVVAYSGGVDSTLLSYLAHQELGANSKSVIADSPSLSRFDYNSALGIADQIGFNLHVIQTNEIENPDYSLNNPKRCFYCKDTVYGQIKKYADSIQYINILDGMNVDDTIDIRPGRVAARNHGIVSPLTLFNFNKSDIREASSFFELPNHNKPASACLSSRVCYGIPVNKTLLNRIEEAELFLRKIVDTDFRVRHHGDVVRIEVTEESMFDILHHKKNILEKFKSLGWLFVTIDLDSVRSGSMNDALLNYSSRKIL